MVFTRIKNLFKKQEPLDAEQLADEESVEFYKALEQISQPVRQQIAPTLECPLIVTENKNIPIGDYNLPSIRNWITDYPAKVNTRMDLQVDDFLQMFCIGMCVYFQADFNDIRDIKDFKNRLAFYNDKSLVRKFEYNIMNKLYCLAEASFPDHYEALCNCRPDRLKFRIQQAIITNSKKELKEALYAIESSDYGFQHMILAHMNEGGRDTWMFNR